MNKKELEAFAREAAKTMAVAPSGPGLSQSRSWRSHWPNLNTLFRYPEDTHKAIHTTNAIESLNSVIRKAIKKRKLFSTDDSAARSSISRSWMHRRDGQCRLGIGRLH